MYTSVTNGVCMNNRYYMYTIFYFCNAVVCFIEYISLYLCDNGSQCEDNVLDIR